MQSVSLLLVFSCYIPWISLTAWKVFNHKLNVFGVLSVCSAGVGLGLNFSNILQFIKRNGKKKVALYTVAPAEIKIGVGSSHNDDPVMAINNAYE